MIFPQAGIAQTLLLAAAALLRYVPPADGPAADLLILLPGFVLLVRLFCPRSIAPLNRYVGRLCSSSPVLIGYIARPYSPANRRLQLMSTGGKVNGVPAADGQRTASFS